jgi:hypothetical protein
MNKILILTIFPFLISCNKQDNPRYNYSENETEQFLDNIAKNAKISIGDITEIKKQPAAELYLLTRYPLSKATLDEYNKNKGTLINKDNDIADFATYTFKDYELINEKNEKLKFVDNGRAIYLREGALWTYNNVLCQNLVIDIKLNKNFEKLKGHITIEFEMPKNTFGKMKKEVKIPVNSTIYDIVPE